MNWPEEAEAREQLLEWPGAARGWLAASSHDASSGKPAGSGGFGLCLSRRERGKSGRNGRASPVRDESSLTGEVPNRDFAGRNNSTRQQATLPEPRSTTQSPLPILLPVASPPPFTSPRLSAGEDQPRPRPISGNTQPPEPLAATRTSPAAGEQERVPPSRFLQENRPAAQSLPSKPEPR